MRMAQFQLAYFKTKEKSTKVKRITVRHGKCLICKIVTHPKTREQIEIDVSARVFDCKNPKFKWNQDKLAIFYKPKSKNKPKQ